ncbi:MAG TPA: DUF4315 family protein [Candidatus Fimicola cottocaccae]|nr:DUF4315 family protein [Candidatus Fimicola cottocaccae]
MNNKIRKICTQINKIKLKIEEQQKKLNDLEKQKMELENMEIVQIVRSTKMNTSELSTFLKTYKNSKVLPPITYKQEENSND